MKYLVTGAAGFIGSTISEKLLQTSHTVIGIDSLTPYYDIHLKKNNLINCQKSENFSFIEDDLNHLKLESIISDVDYIIHLAAQPGVRKSWGPSFHEYVEQNLMATQKILESCIKNPVKKIVIASSSSVYGSSHGSPLTENDATMPESPYGVTKLAMEKLVMAYYKNFELPVSLLRYFTVYGPRQRPDMAFHKFLKSIFTNNEITIFGDGTQKRDFTYVDDAVDATISSCTLAPSGSILNIGGGKSVELNNVLEIIKSLSDSSFKISYEEKQKGDVYSTSANIQKANELINYSPNFDLETGIKNQLEWMKKMINLKKI